MASITTSIRVLCPDTDGLHRLTLNLRDAIAEADVDEVRPATRSVPTGGKTADAIAVGELVVTLAPIVADGLVAVLVSWLSRQPSDVEIEVDGQKYRGPATRAQRDALIAALLRHLDTER